MATVRFLFKILTPVAHFGAAKVVAAVPPMGAGGRIVAGELVVAGSWS